ncbi:ABC transporter substrate-binding protein [Paenibacillus sp. P36]|uniref:ABC transporter substrate-binding protein n=1 Tax=Paenibacillus sp. P36 TaxID=3342538 RepID=UPI0038B2E8B8
MVLKQKLKLTFVLTLTSGVLLAGCSNNASTDDKAESTPVSSINATNGKDGGNAAMNGYPIVKDKLTLNFVMAKATQQKKATDQLKVVNDLEALTNIHIKWDASDQGYQEKKNLMFASGDLPDGFFGSGSLTDADILKYGTQGMLIPLEKLIDQYAPNIKQLLTNQPDVKKMLTAPDGHIYSIPTVITEGANELGEVLFVNKDWMDKLRLSVPTTTVEFEKVLNAFKNGGDLNGNGQKDEIPFSFLNGNPLNGIYGVYGAFGIPDNGSHVMVQDGKVSYIANRPEYKAATQYFNGLYKQGLIDQEAFTQDRNIYFSKGRGKGKPVYGAFTGYNAENVVGPDNAKSYVAIAPLKGPNGQQLVNLGDTLAVTKSGFSITSANKHVAETMRWINSVFEERHSVEWEFGPIGVNFKETNGDKYEYLPTPAGTTYDDFRCTEAPCFGGTGAITEEIYKKIELSDKIKGRLAYLKIYQPFMKRFTLPSGMFFTIEDSDRMNVLSTDINELVKKKQAQWIIDGNVDAEWDSYLTQLKKIGLDEFLQIYQRTYDRFQSVK